MLFRFAQHRFKELGCLGKELRFASPRRFAPTRLRLPTLRSTCGAFALGSKKEKKLTPQTPLDLLRVCATIA